jgi:RecA-family ATPase
MENTIETILSDAENVGAIDVIDALSNASIQDKDVENLLELEYVTSLSHEENVNEMASDPLTFCAEFLEIQLRFLQNKKRSSRDFKETLAWMMSDSDRDFGFKQITSFVADALGSGLDYSDVRSKILQNIARGHDLKLTGYFR